MRIVSYSFLLLFLSKFCIILVDIERRNYMLNLFSIFKKKVIKSEDVIIEEQPLDVTNPLSEEAEKREYIKSRISEVYEKGIVLLEPMDIEQRKIIHKIVRSIPDIISFNIYEDGKRPIVLKVRYQYKEGDLNFKEILIEGDNAYKKGDYDECIKIYRKSLDIGKPASFVYAKIGYAYMGKLDFDTAIDYLTVATELSKKEENYIDYTDIIENLKERKRELEEYKKELKK